MENVEIGPVSVARGSHGFGFLPLATMADGGDLGIAVHIVAGARPGPKVTVMTASHGNEFGQISALMRLVDELDPEQMTGDLVLVPVQNPIAFEMGARGTWVDGIWGDSGNLNRVWPGRAHGWLTERISNKIATLVWPGSTVIMDLHGPTPDLHLSYGYVGEGGPDGLDYQLSRVFGQELLVWNSPEDLKEKGQTTSTAKAAARLAGYAGYGGEIGEFFGLGMDRDSHSPERLYRSPAELGFTGITNVMKHLEMIEGEIRRPPRQIRVTPELNLRPNHGGLLRSNMSIKDLGTVVPGGTVLGTVLSPYSFKPLEDIVAPFKENILIATHHKVPFSKVLPGEFVYLVSDHSRTEYFD